MADSAVAEREVACGFGPNELPPMTALYHQPAGRSQLGRCQEPTRSASALTGAVAGARGLDGSGAQGGNYSWDDCEVCFPPYRTVQVATFCMPDPRHALRTFAAVATAVGVSASSFGSAARGDDGVPTVAELEAMRTSVNSAPHQVYEDLIVSYRVILLCIGCSGVFGLVWVLTLRACAHLMVWATLAAVGGGLGLGTYSMYVTQDGMRHSYRYERPGDEHYTQQTDTLHVCFYAVAVLTALYVLAVLWLRARIVIAVKVMKEATKAVGAHPTLLILPLLTLLLSALIASYALFVALLLVSTGWQAESPSAPISLSRPPHRHPALAPSPLLPSTPLPPPLPSAPPVASPL